MLRFSANLGFLWTELPLPAAIMAAAKAGFDAVECHWPFDVPSSEIMAALTATKLPMLGLNTRRGNVDAGDLALPPALGAKMRHGAILTRRLIMLLRLALGRFM